MDVVPYADMPHHYQETDLMLHTSLSEGQCMALTEAAASGVLMAGTRVGLLWDLGERCAIVVEPGDFAGLADQVLDILPRTAEWRDKVESARKWSAGHSFDWTVNEFTSLIRSL